MLRPTDPINHNLPSQVIVYKHTQREPKMMYTCYNILEYKNKCKTADNQPQISIDHRHFTRRHCQSQSQTELNCQTHIHFQSQATCRLGFRPILIYYLVVRISGSLSTTDLSSTHLYITIPTLPYARSDSLCFIFIFLKMEGKWCR